MLQVFLAASETCAGQPSMWEANANKPVPIGAKVTLELDRPEYFLGENVLVHFILKATVTNLSKRILGATTGEQPGICAFR